MNWIFEFISTRIIFASLLLFLMGSLYFVFRSRLNAKGIGAFWFAFFILLVLPIDQIFEFESGEAQKVLFLEQATAVSTQMREAIRHTSFEIDWLQSLYWLGFSVMGIATLILPLYRQRKRDLLLKEKSQDCTKEFYSLLDNYLETKAIKVYRCSEVEAPFVSGFFSFRVFLPEYLFSDFTKAQRQAILYHEVGHIVHRDAIKTLFVRGVLCFFWFFLPLYYVYEILKEAQEQAADEFSLATNLGFGKKEYAESLVMVAEKMSLFKLSPFQLGFFRKGDLKRRLEMLKERRKTSRILTFLLVLTAGTLAFAAVSKKKQNDPLRINGKIEKHGEVIANPQIIALPREQFEIVIASDEEFYSFKGIARYDGDDTIDLTSTHCFGSPPKLEEDEAIDLVDHPNNCERQYKMRIRTKLGEPMVFDVGEPNNDSEMKFTFLIRKQL